MRSLVEKWDSRGTIDREQILNRVVNEIIQINVPMTAINGTLFLTIFEENANYTPINRASLVEQFLETILEKRNPSDVQRRTFDFQHKVHALSALAHHMTVADEYVLPHDHVVSIIQKHFERLGFNWNARSVVEDFINARVLWVRNGDEVSFRYRAYLEYFIAHRMKGDEDFRNWVLSKEQYLSFINEIQYYAGSVRTDASLLELIGERFDALTKRLEERVDWSPDPSRLDKYKPIAIESEGDIFAEYEEQLAAPSFTPEERDRILEAEFPTDIENRQEVFRPRIVDLGAQWTNSLFLYSSILKNLEIVDDVVKRKHLKKILWGWSILTMQSLAVVPILARDRQIIINGIKYQVLVPKSMSDHELARFISIDLPNSLSRLLTGFMGTEKLEKQLLEPMIDEASEPKITRFFRIALAADLRLRRWPSVVRQFSSELKEHKYILEAFLRKMREIYLLGGLDDGDQRRLQSLLGDGIALLSGVPAAQRIKNKGRRIQTLAKEALIQRLRRFVTTDD
jgi:hypothetical protein